ncbi:MAG: hypothetical protein ACXABY_00775 [Candidatus Thorarchaeota archaeon]|jgi:hypothetical protein
MRKALNWRSVLLDALESFPIVPLVPHSFESCLPDLTSAIDRINARRLVLHLRKLIWKAGVVTDFHDPESRMAFLDRVNTAIWRLLRDSPGVKASFSLYPELSGAIVMVQYRSYGLAATFDAREAFGIDFLA